jgi:ribA/ribD-fused uncharacterized protein
MSQAPITSRTELSAYLKHGGRVHYLFFWGHQPEPDGSISKRCLSQWFEAPFEIDGVRYATAEHYMMAEKARLFNDRQTLELVLKASNPAAAKAAGRAVKNFDEGLWVARRFEIVVAANVAKFSQNSALGEFLCRTGDKILVEASPVDRIWGIGLAGDHPHAGNPATWQGLNLLGFALMQARAQLR